MTLRNLPKITLLITGKNKIQVQAETCSICSTEPLHYTFSPYYVRHIIISMLLLMKCDFNIYPPICSSIHPSIIDLSLNTRREYLLSLGVPCSNKNCCPSLHCLSRSCSMLAATGGRFSKLLLPG